MSPPQRSDEIWFDDGNVVVQAEQMVFKVYKGILCRESTLFEGMLALPIPFGDQSDYFDNCPLIKMSDRAEEIALFLSVMFNYEYVLFDRLTVGHQRIDY